MMKQKRALRFWYVGLIVGLAVTVLVGCSGGETTLAPADADSGGIYTTTNLDTSYPNALDAGGQLALGTLRLEETGNGVTSGQAAALLPLWQAIQGGTLQGEAEMNVVLEQIEGEMTQEQLTAIATMQLTRDDLQVWTQSQGLNPGRRGDQEPPAGAQSPGGGKGGQGGDRDELSSEEMEALRATVEAGGAGTSQLTILLKPLVELLTQRAAE
jgi:hypothetical protein